jgi:hypothetical protein
VDHAAGEQDEAHHVDGQRRGAGDGQHGQGRDAGRHIFGGVAEGADGAGQFRDALVAQGDLVLLAQAHDQQRQDQQQEKVQAGPQRRGVAGSNRIHR